LSHCAVIGSNSTEPARFYSCQRGRSTV
jgi:hypothetical protein